LLQNVYVKVHNNAISLNASYGDEVNSTTPAAAGGVTFCSGADFYDFAYNWVGRNMSTGDGGGFAHYGCSYNGMIEHNAFLFNQSSNPTLTTWGGGIVVQGPAVDGDVGETSLVDVDVAPALTDGIGPGLRIDHNLFQGNTAESGSGGGLRLQGINGNDVLNNPTNPSQWYSVAVTNNIFANNVAGWAGGGVSIQDAVRVSFDDNTVASNDSTATAGVQDVLGAGTERRRVLVQPRVPHHGRRAADVGGAAHAGAVPDHDRLVPERRDLLGHRRAGRHGTDEPRLRADAAADGVECRNRRLSGRERESE